MNINPSISNTQPQNYPRRILLATLGKSPAVLTETLYHMACIQSPPNVPTEIHVVTTAEGAHRAKLSLLDPSMAKLKVLSDNYSLNDLSLALPLANIHTITDAAGSVLEDITSAEHSAATADLITSLVRQFTSDVQSSLHVSIAGGRKTMGFLLGYALTIFGRQQDRLSHVLVNEPFDTMPEFFFPPRQPVVLIDRSGRPASTQTANIRLAEIPFIKLRQGMPSSLISGNLSYSETVRLAQPAFQPPTMTLEHENCSIICSGTVISLQPMTFAVAAWFARRCKVHGMIDGSVSAKKFGTKEMQEIRNEYELIPHSIRPPASRRLLVHDITNTECAAFFAQHLSHFKKALRQNLGPSCKNYEPIRKYTAGIFYHAFPLAPDEIHFSPIRAFSDHIVLYPAFMK